MNMNKLLTLFLRGQHTNNTTSERIRVGRTLEGTVFELTFVVLLIIVWALLIYFLRQTPDIVPTHFGPSRPMPTALSISSWSSASSCH